MKLVEFSTRRPVSIFIFAVAAVLFGSIAFNDLATDLLPDISYPSITVRTAFDGAAPLEVESLVTRPVENAVGVVNSCGPEVHWSPNGDWLALGRPGGCD